MARPPICKPGLPTTGEFGDSVQGFRPSDYAAARSKQK